MADQIWDWIATFFAGRWEWFAGVFSKPLAAITLLDVAGLFLSCAIAYLLLIVIAAIASD